MEHPALRRCFYKIAKGCCTKRLLYSEILCGSLFSGLFPVCYSGLLLAGEML